MYSDYSQPDYSLLVLIIVVASIVDLIIPYLIIRTAVKEGVNRSVLGSSRIKTELPGGRRVESAKGAALLRTLTLRLKSIISRNGVKVQACRFES